MPLTHLYTLVCDDVRVENNGKLIVIGMYLPNILVPQLPFVLPTLCFLQAYNGDERRRYQFNARLQNLETGREIGQSMGIIGVEQPGLVIGVIRLANVILERAGSYTLSMNVENHAEPFQTGFDVILQSIQPLMQQRPN